MSESLRVCNRVDELPRVRAWLSQLPAVHGCSKDMVAEVWLILDELLTNIITHGYDDTSIREIEVSVGRRGAHLLLELRDDARAFNPLEQPFCPEVHPESGGWGLQLVRSLSDQLHYDREGGYNVLKIEKAIVLA